MFGKEKESKEFFEVFNKKLQTDAKCDSKVLERDQVNPTVLPRPNQQRNQDSIDESSNAKQLGWIKDTQREKKVQSDAEEPRTPSRNEVVIKQETLIFGALGAVFLSLVCFFVGYKIGNKDVLNPETLQETIEYSTLEGGVKTIPQDRKINTVDLSTKKPEKVPAKSEENVKWTLQIISYSNTKQHIKKARDLAKAIKNMTNHNTFVAKRGKEIVVCTGKFNSKDSNELKRALNEISKLEYEGKKQFASSYPIQVR
ncbi:lipoate synthase [Candidatus Scalindua japonica]|uniref:Lipoate synthase n=1 Tax=Candidatus Scalindua japonica TaxID=1284222 RepID=A0A286TYW4_9BACT|nr:hypothetical protein [Candidatus Scalindua japonica]GAX61093.1 lipoate synthase [Candidatus Scalindua japonica]